MPVVDLEPDAGRLEVLGAIMRKQFLQSGPRSTEFGMGDNKFWKITLNAVLLLLTGLSLGCILVNGTNRQFMAVGSIDKCLKMVSVWPLSSEFFL